MGLFEKTYEMGHQEIIYCSDPSVGLKAIIAIHNTNLGPALGGCRMWHYDCEEGALEDVLRLSRGMTYKCAAMGMKLGGGKSVIIADPKKDKTPELFKAFGRFVESLGGRYITAEDVGTNEEDMNYILEETSHVVGLKGKSGNPSPVTAKGVFLGIKASLEWVFGTDELNGRTIAIQGVGNVGYELARLLTEGGAKVIAANTSPERIEKAKNALGVLAVHHEDIFDVECDVFSPCAMGAVINDNTIERFRCKIIAGAANNQLQDSQMSVRLMEKGILYAPDYVINGGGVINVMEEMSGGGYDYNRVMANLQIIPKRLTEIYDYAQKNSVSTAEACDRVTERQFQR